MTASRIRPGSRRQRGVGIVELMIVLVIGLLMVIGMAYFFIGSRLTNRATDDVSRMQESGRNALEVMGLAIRQAGYRSIQFGPQSATPFAGVAVTGTNGAGSAPDTITVQYAAQTGGETSCTGTAVAAGGMVTAAFAVNNGVNPPVLTCNGTVVVDNVEDVQISYGIRDGNGNIENYKIAPTAAEFAMVAAVQVSLLVRGPSTNVATNAQTFLFDGRALPADGFLRQIYNATFTVRNQAL